MKVQRLEATDVLTRAGETAVLIDGVVLRLSEISAEIYALTEHLVEVSRLATDLESRFGAPEGTTTRQATDAAVAELIHHGLLRASS
ncbi:MAG TPA: hypothetical protein PLG38_13055 [Propionibacteriaceae bacterium]|nr:hypothetical protein [Propionibacteriaceae bacterium]